MVSAEANRRLMAVCTQLAAQWPHDQPTSIAAGPRQNAASDRGDSQSDVAARSVSFLATLVRAQNDVEQNEPCPGEMAVQRAISARLTQLGASVTSMRYVAENLVLQNEYAAPSAVQAGERVSVIGHLPADGGGGRSLILFGHPDGEPVSRTDEWSKDPFAAEIIDGRIYGWGVADDLMGVAAGVCALDVLAERGTKLKGDVMMCSTPSKRNANGVTAVMQNMELAGTADAAVYLHPAESGAGLREIKALASGQLKFKITVCGSPPETTEPGHVAFAHLAVNPLDKALQLRDAIYKLGEERASRVHHPALEKAVGRSTNVLIASVASGESSPARIPATCEMEGAISYPPPETLVGVQAEFQKCMDAAIAEDEWMSEHPPTIEWTSGTTATYVPPEHPLYATVENAVETITGIKPFVNALHTSSDIRVPMVQQSIPCVGIGSLSGNLSQNNLVDEWVDVADFVKLVHVTAQVITDWCGVVE